MTTQEEKVPVTEKPGDGRREKIAMQLCTPLIKKQALLAVKILQLESLTNQVAALKAQVVDEMNGNRGT